MIMYDKYLSMLKDEFKREIKPWNKENKVWYLCELQVMLGEKEESLEHFKTIENGHVMMNVKIRDLHIKVKKNGEIKEYKQWIALFRTAGAALSIYIQAIEIYFKK